MEGFALLGRGCDHRHDERGNQNHFNDEVMHRNASAHALLRLAVLSKKLACTIAPADNDREWLQSGSGRGELGAEEQAGNEKAWDEGS